MSVKGNNIERSPSSLRPPKAGATGSGSQSRGNAKQTRSSDAASPYLKFSDFDRSFINASGPCVLFASPGMISGGFSLEVFKQWAPSEKNIIALPGFPNFGCHMKTKFNQNFKIEVQENANQDCDSKVLKPSREAIHESRMIPETQSRRSQGRPAAAEEPRPSSGSSGAGPKQRRAEDHEVTKRRRRLVRAAAADDRGGDQRRRHRRPRSGRITGPRSPVDGKRQRIKRRGSGGG
ncbi:hypothetical protein Syun_015417 [Stephania yunnanensis]|uniref:Beta-Casp domain-containing protein n=1 Tax=Stephania yunnanensis TaxID=152371 RepID=A0AAP0P9P6_9MAGN